MTLLLNGLVTAAELTDLRMRAVAAVQAGEFPETVTRIMGVSRSALYGWLALYRESGWDNLTAQKRGARPSKLDDEQLQWLYEAITQNRPDQWGLSSTPWPIKAVRILIHKQFGIELSKSTVHRLLHHLGLSPQRSRWNAQQQDAGEVRQYKEDNFPELAARAAGEDGEIWFADEAGVRSDAHAGTTWAPQGQTPLVRTTGARCRVNLISAISREGELRLMTDTGRMNAARFIGFLQRMSTESERKIFLIVDGHPVHKAQKARKFVEARPQQIELHFLPAYSPELSPDEHVWNELKASTIDQKAINGPGHLKKRVQSHLHRIQKLPEKVKSYFQAPPKPRM